MIQANFILPCMLKKDKEKNLCSLYHLLCPNARAVGYRKYPIMLGSYKFIKHNFRDFVLSSVNSYYDITDQFDYYFDASADGVLYVIHPSFIKPTDSYLSYFFMHYLHVHHKTGYLTLEEFMVSGNDTSTDHVIWDTLNNVIVSFNRCAIETIFNGFKSF